LQVRPLHSLDARPRDFSARYRRARWQGIGQPPARKRRGRHALVLLGAVALPAFAAPDQWSVFEIGNAGSGGVDLQPMPFEKSGSSFPGSAFYYLESDRVTVRGFGEGIHSDADSAPLPDDPVAGPVARGMRIDNSGIDRTRALQCLTAAVYYEAASEPDSGQRAVAQVVLNRVAHPAYPNTVCGVVFQGSERKTGCQFSFTCDGSMARRPSRMFWLRAEAVAMDALSGYVHTPAGLATHYHTIHVHPYWAPSLHYLGTIGLHRFYRFQGRAGQAGTFRFAYAGGEPIAAPHARSDAATADSPASAIDPLAVQAAYESGLKAAQEANPGPAAGAPSLTGTPPVHHAAPPSYAEDVRQRGGDALYKGEKLPDATGIKPEFQNSGRWIARPGT